MPIFIGGAILMHVYRKYDDSQTIKVKVFINIELKINVYAKHVDFELKMEQVKLK